MFLARFILFTAVCCQAAELPAFKTVTVVRDLKMGYQLVLADLNKDGRKDIIVVDERSTELAWYENPGWERHVLAVNVPRVINLETLDLDGDGIPEIVMAHQFETNPEKSVGNVLFLKSGSDPRQPWQAKEIDRVPTAHRIRWIFPTGPRDPLLLVAPLVGMKARAPEYKDRAPIYAYKPGDWKRQTISEELTGVLHSIAPVDWEGKGKQQLLTASFDGLRLLEPAKHGPWKVKMIATGDPRPCPQCGSSEVKLGRLGKRRLLAAIEPWHGNQVVAYVQQGKSWQRHILDDTMVNGHALAVADLNGDGRDEIVAGFRGKGFRVTVFQAEDAAGTKWRRHVLDEGGVAAADCKIDDLNGDGRPDIACSGASTGNVVIFEGTGAVSQRRR